ncbi:MAG: glycosyltransferase [Thiotrichaceae bacterium]|nr:glycosyltransferase [Thiotrichaceae bacterium]
MKNSLTLKQAIDLATQSYQAQEFDKTQIICQKIIQQAPKTDIAWYLMGMVAQHYRQYEQAIHYFQKNIKIQPKAIDAYQQLANVLTSLEQHRRALKYTKIALEMRLATKPDVDNLINVICNTDVQAWHQHKAQLQAYGQLLEQTGYFKTYDAQKLQKIVKALPISHISETKASEKIACLIALLGFHKTSSKTWNKTLFDNVVLAWFKNAFELKYYDLGLDLEKLIYSNYIQQIETESHFKQAYIQLIPAMREAGLKQKSALAKLSIPTLQQPYKIGFFIHNASLLAHVQVLVNMLEGLMQMDKPLFQPYVFIFEGKSIELEQRLQNKSIPVTYLNQHTSSFYQRLILLRQQIQQKNIHAIVWTSVSSIMSFAFAMQVAPVQIWWAMKYHEMALPEIDGYVTNSSVEQFKQIGSRLWRAGGGAFSAEELYQADFATEAEKIRAYYSAFDIILGSFGREEKLDSSTFITAVIQILQKYPKAAFLWTGRHQLSSIQQQFSDAGVAQQCFFIGWVDTRLYAQVIDIFLDSFPFPCGVTLMQSMAAGKPFVCHVSHEAEGTGTQDLIYQLLYMGKGLAEAQALAQETLQKGKFYFRATSIEEYIQLASTLIEDKTLREAAGLAQQAFSLAFFQNKQLSAQRFGQHFIEIINESYAAMG